MPNARYYRARVQPLGDGGLIHFLICEDAGRSPEQTSFDVMAAGFLSSRFNSPLHEMANRADLTELDEATFAFTRGARIPSDEVSGMTFWWLR